jgi:hypothetical protein
MDAATLLDGVPCADTHTGFGDGMAPPVVWDADRDGQATEGMNPVVFRHGDGVVRQMMRRRGMVVAAWLALATSGVVCSMMEGKRSAAGQSDVASDGQSAAGTEVHAGVAGKASGPVTLTWMRAVSEQIRCAVDSMGVRPARTAGGRFEGKMDPARARRCPTVQNAEPIEAERLWSRPARRAGTGRSLPSAPPSPPRSFKGSPVEAVPAMARPRASLPAKVE